MEKKENSKIEETKKGKQGIILAFLYREFYFLNSQTLTYSFVNYIQKEAEKAHFLIC